MASSRRAGIKLIELFVVVLVLVGLASVLLPILSRSKELAKQAIMRADARQPTSAPAAAGDSASPVKPAEFRLSGTKVFESAERTHNLLKNVFVVLKFSDPDSPFPVITAFTAGQQIAWCPMLSSRPPEYRFRGHWKVNENGELNISGRYEPANGATELPPRLRNLKDLRYVVTRARLRQGAPPYSHTLDLLIKRAPHQAYAATQPAAGAKSSWVEPMFAPRDLKVSVPKQLPKELGKSDAFLAVLRWHEYASSNSVRMTWFLHGGLNVAMVCSIDLDSGEWLTSCEVYDWASQGTKTGCLDAEGLAAVKKIVEKLPASVDSVDPTFVVIISTPAGKHRSLRIYNRRQLPEPVAKLYASAGAYIDTTDYDVKSSSQPATQPK